MLCQTNRLAIRLKSLLYRKYGKLVILKCNGPLTDTLSGLEVATVFCMYCTYRLVMGLVGRVLPLGQVLGQFAPLNFSFDSPLVLSRFKSSAEF